MKQNDLDRFCKEFITIEKISTLLRPLEKRIETIEKNYIKYPELTQSQCVLTDIPVDLDEQKDPTTLREAIDYVCDEMEDNVGDLISSTRAIAERCNDDLTKYKCVCLPNHSRRCESCKQDIVRIASAIDEGVKAATRMESERYEECLGILQTEAQMHGDTKERSITALDSMRKVMDALTAERDSLREEVSILDKLFNEKSRQHAEDVTKLIRLRERSVTLTADRDCLKTESVSLNETLEKYDTDQRRIIEVLEGQAIVGEIVPVTIERIVTDRDAARKQAFDWQMRYQKAATSHACTLDVHKEWHERMEQAEGECKRLRGEVTNWKNRAEAWEETAGLRARMVDRLKAEPTPIDSVELERVAGEMWRDKPPIGDQSTESLMLTAIAKRNAWLVKWFRTVAGRPLAAAPVDEAAIDRVAGECYNIVIATNSTAKKLRLIKEHIHTIAGRGMLAVTEDEIWEVIRSKLPVGERIEHHANIVRDAIMRLLRERCAVVPGEEEIANVILKERDVLRKAVGYSPEAIVEVKHSVLAKAIMRLLTPPAKPKEGGDDND